MTVHASPHPAPPRRIVVTIALAFLSASPNAALASNDGIWSPFVAAGFPRAEDALVACDPGAQRIYLFGPRTPALYGSNTNETYILDMASVPPRFHRLSVVGPRPSARYGGALLFDPHRRRLLLIGGRSLQASITETEVWELTLEEPPQWRRLEPTGAIPGPRVFPVAVYDARRDRVVVHGGARIVESSNFSLSDTWTLSLSPELAWSKLTTAGAEPPALAGSGGVYDSRRDQLLLYGGGQDSEFRNPRRDLWRLTLAGTPTWSLEATAGTPPQIRTSGGAVEAVYDSTRDHLYVVSSDIAAEGAPDLLALTRMDLSAGRQWEIVPSTGFDPGMRFESSVALVGGTLVCVAGRSSKGPESDARALDLETGVWTDLAPTGTRPAILIDAQAALDSSRSRVIVRGGYPPEIWLLQLDTAPTWRRPSVAGSGPTTAGIPIAWDATGARLLAVDVTAVPNAQVWALTLDPAPTWSLLATSNSGPPSRGGASVTFDARRNRLLVMGGFSDFMTLSQVWQLRLDPVPTWDTLNPLPVSRSGARSAVDQSRDQIVLFGGFLYNRGINQSLWHGETWVRSLAEDSEPWRQLPTTGDPPQALRNFVRDAARDRILYGASFGKEVWALKLGTAPAWSKLLAPNPPYELNSFVPAIMDGAHDRLLFPISDYPTGSQLGFGAPSAPPGLICPGDGFMTPGSIREVSFGLEDRAGLGLTYEYTLTCSREWPGFPIRGLALPSGFSMEYVRVGIPIPDTSTVGAVQFTLQAAAREQAELESTCAFELQTGPAPVVAMGGDALPDRVVVRWRTTLPGLTVTIARRTEFGPWAAMARQSLSQPGVVTYEDRVVQTDQRYYYRAEISDPIRSGAYGQIRVDVPEWSLAFAADQPNPVRGRFTIECGVAAAGRTELDIFDLNGRHAFAEGRVASGPGRVSFDVDGGRQLPPGIYFLRLTQGALTRQRTIVLLR